MEKRNSHKIMKKGKVYTGELDLVERFARRFDLQFDIHTDSGEYLPEQGHMLYSESDEPVAWVRSQLWRATTTQVLPQRSDIGKFTCEKREFFNPFASDMGLELEPTIINKQTGAMVSRDERPDLFNTMQQQLQALRTGCSPELLKGTWELDLGHNTDPQERKSKMSASLLALIEAVEAQDSLVIPFSCLPNTPTPSDITNHPYIQRMALQVEGFDRAKWFAVMSSQMHWKIDGDWQTAFSVINLMQQITPILFAASLSGPIAVDSITPNPAEIFANDQSLQHIISLDKNQQKSLQHNTWLSCRPWLRLFGSTSSGPLDKPLPKDLNSFFASAEGQLRRGKIPTPVREPGPHKDFRPRFDLGTIECCFFDTFGGNIDQLAEFQTLTGVLLAKLWHVVTTRQEEKLIQEFPSLFSSLDTENLFALVFSNTLAVAKRGVQADIQRITGESVSCQALVTDLLYFAHTPLHDEERNIHFNGLDEHTRSVVKNAFTVPTQEDFQQWTRDNLPSARFFFETGKGTLAHACQARIKALQELGFPEDEIIENVKRDVGESFHEHVKACVGK